MYSEYAIQTLTAAMITTPKTIERPVSPRGPSGESGSSLDDSDWTDIVQD